VTEDDKLLNVLTGLTNSALAQVSMFTGTVADVDILTQNLQTLRRIFDKI
jgi:hypothetical protein